MKKVLLILLTALTIIGCGKGNQGELVGVKQKKFFPTTPHGMLQTIILRGRLLYVPFGWTKPKSLTQNINNLLNG